MVINISEFNVLTSIRTGEVKTKDIKGITDQKFFDAVALLILSNNNLHTFSVVESLTSHHLANPVNIEEMINIYIQNVNSFYSIRNIAGGLSRLEARQALYKASPKHSASSYIGMEDVIPYKEALELATTNTEFAEKFLVKYPSVIEVEDFLWDSIRKSPKNASIFAINILAEKTSDPERILFLSRWSTCVLDNPNFNAQLAFNYMETVKNNEQNFSRFVHLEDDHRFNKLMSSLQK
jgi:hypothetical protein